MKYKDCLIILALFLDAKTLASTGNKSSNLTSKKFDCRMSKFMNEKKILKIDPQKGYLRFEIPYVTTNCSSQSYELKVKRDSLIIIQQDSLESCYRHETGYFLVGSIGNLKKGKYILNVAQGIGVGVRYSLIKNPIKIEIP
jgi:hypothetical protein